MTKKVSKRKASAREASKSGVPGPAAERRKKRELREVLDELVEYVRQVSDSLETMSPPELEYTQERLQWLVDELWRLVLEKGDSRIVR